MIRLLYLLAMFTGFRAAFNTGRSFFLPKLRVAIIDGHGHVEIAFYETHENVTVDAVRNILRSNIARLGLHKNFGGLKFSCDHDEIVLLKRILNRLNSLGLKTCFASPDECVSLAVSPSLLVPKQRNLAIEALRDKYRRIERKLRTVRIMAKGSEKHPGELTYQVVAK